ncbi:hypothetical protein B0T10DRAFT_43906 [Thelonectria olida]|uniref:Uncharacterized protein n=1 Tax=Thelonectria olida TaxID=1576542 RepID=A0A9P8W5T3_9HYPO|nr:hypothetical protein B0T10DRAFT_43906 [Thelonectria olida]
MALLDGDVILTMIAQAAPHTPKYRATSNPELDSSVVSTSLSLNTKATISNAFWGCRSSVNRQLNATSIDLEPYWRYYTNQCDRALHDGGQHIATRTHRDVVDTVSKLKAGVLRTDLKSDLKSNLTSSHANEDELLENSVNLAATLLLMTSFGSYSYGYSGRSLLQWTDGTLRDFVHGYFAPVADPLSIHDNIRLEKNFNALNLGRIAGLEIVWTDNIADHLRLADHDTRVHVFHHASFLEYQRQSRESLLPEGLAEETLQTLALLFPSSDLETKEWFAKLPFFQSLDRRVIQCDKIKTNDRKIETFKFWRARLISLKQVFDEAQPKTLVQWWFDRRDGVQWYTFWVAVLVLVLTVFFGLVQSIEGGIQVYASLKALHNE